MRIREEWCRELVNVSRTHVLIACEQTWAAYLPETDRWYRTLRDLLLAGF